MTNRITRREIEDCAKVLSSLTGKQLEVAGYMPDDARLYALLTEDGRKLIGYSPIRAFYDECQAAIRILELMTR